MFCYHKIAKNHKTATKKVGHGGPRRAAEEEAAMVAALPSMQRHKGCGGEELLGYGVIGDAATA